MADPRSPARPSLARFRVLAAGSMVSTFGGYLNMVALNLFVYQATGSAVGVGAFLALRLGCGFVAGLGAGWVAARLPRRAVLIGSNLVQAASLTALAVSPEPVQLTLLPVVAVVSGVLGTVSAVVLRSSVPDLVGPEHRVAANGLLVTGRAVATAAGFAAGAVLVGWLGYRAAFAVDAATFLAPALILLLVPMPFARPRRDSAPVRRERHDKTWRRTAFAALATTPVIAVIVAVRAADAFGSASHNVGLPVYATQIRPGDPAGFVGTFFAVWAVGLIVAHQAVRLARRRLGAAYDDPARTQRGFIIGTCVMSIAFVVAFAGLPTAGMLGVALVAGIADGYTEITYSTRLQAEPEPARGYAFGLTAMAENGGFGAGMLVAGGLIDLWGPFTTALAMHGVVVLLAVALSARIGLARAKPAAAPGPASTGPATTGPASTGPATTGPATTGPATTGPATTGPASTGSASPGPAAREESHAARDERPAG
ncbi:MFS transporter [Symbioplanes lichenis]|uniref:MFS transporter n=1 Tax=Symbioplanes lichenis TaxID=1629072 RepID=UPI002739A550|nr:MFS transporter [Actinoplanes lichenis]